VSTIAIRQDDRARIHVAVPSSVPASRFKHSLIFRRQLDF
jgi:hypothetical protein